MTDYLSKKEDHWGFYNNNAYNINPISTFYSQRESNSSSAINGIISDIIWPTKGTTHFEFESNDYNSYVDDGRVLLHFDSGIAGGLRIKSIIENDGKEQIVRSYKYVNNFATNHSSTTSSGILRAKSRYYWESWGFPSTQQPNGYYLQKIFSVNSIVPNSNYFGSHIGYSEVTELRSDSSYSVFKFSNFDTSDPTISFLDEPSLSFWIDPSPYTKYNDFGFCRGKILNETMYSYDTIMHQERKVLQKDYFYHLSDGLEAINGKYIISTNAMINTVICGYNNFLLFYSGTAYKIFYSRMLLDRIVTKHYFGTDLTCLTQTDEFQYNTYDLMSKKKSSTSDGQFEQSETIFLADFVNENHPVGSTLDNMINRNLFGIPLQFNKYNHDLKQIGGTAYKYYLLGSNYMPVVIGEYNLETEIPLQSADIISFSNGEENIPISFKQKYSFTNFDQAYNNCEVSKISDIYTTILWGYNYSKPIAKIENARLTEVLNALAGLTPACNYTALQNKTNAELITLCNKLREAIPHARITSYTYLPFIGISSQTDVNGKTTFFEYDLFNRLSNIMDSEQNHIKMYKYHYMGE